MDEVVIGYGILGTVAIVLIIAATWLYAASRTREEQEVDRVINTLAREAQERRSKRPINPPPAAPRRPARETVVSHRVAEPSSHYDPLHPLNPLNPISPFNSVNTAVQDSPCDSGSRYDGPSGGCTYESTSSTSPTYD